MTRLSFGLFLPVVALRWITTRGIPMVIIL